MEAPSDNFLESCLFFNINTFSRNLVKLAEAEFKPLGLSPAHASMLLLIYDTPGISPKELSRLLQLNPSTITRFIDALVKRKWVRRQNMGKQAYIHPTPKSLERKHEVAQAYKNLFYRYSQILGRENAILISQSVLKANNAIKEAMAPPSDNEPELF